MAVTPALGPLIATGQVADILLAHLKGWLPMYLSEMDDQFPAAGSTGRGYTSTPKSWEIVPAFDLSDNPQMPAIKIVTPGPTEEPKSDGEGRVRCVYENNVVAIVAAPDSAKTKALRDRYESAITGAVMHKRSLGDPNVRGTDYMGASHFDLPAEERRTKQAVMCRFLIEYENIVTWKAGPSQPIFVPDPYAVPPVDPTQPIPDLGTVEDPAAAPGYAPVTITKEDS